MRVLRSLHFTASSSYCAAVHISCVYGANRLVVSKRERPILNHDLHWYEYRGRHRDDAAQLS